PGAEGRRDQARPSADPALCHRRTPIGGGIIDSMSCLFCRIIAGEIPASKVYEDEHAVAFNDINPQAPMHVLIVPRVHVATLNDLVKEHSPIIGEMVRRGAAIAAERGYAERGYRAVFNCNQDGG